MHSVIFKAVIKFMCELGSTFQSFYNLMQIIFEANICCEVKFLRFSFCERSDDKICEKAF